MNSPCLSLVDLLGKEFTDSVINAGVALNVYNEEEGRAIAETKVEFYPAEVQARDDSLLDKVGKRLIEPFDDKLEGAGTTAFKKATNISAAPLTGSGCFRLGSDGRLYLTGKSEHYHAPLGHRFPGYRLIELGKRLGFLNPTHNNTRGYITRLLERKLIQAVNGTKDEDETDKILQSTEPKILNRVINLETGSLAAEAGIKMMLTRFYRLDSTYPEPKYHGKTPVFFVMADQKGGFEANYHGTTVFAQTLRGMWPEFYGKAEESELYKVVSVTINDIEDFKTKITEYNTNGYKTAGFLHEIILMNYGGVKLERDYLREAYELCEGTDTPTMVDEIQSCMWYRGMLLYRIYGLRPDFVILGKGFPGGEYPASKVITTFEMDTLNQFGALVTNGQEEHASLAYLITMAFMEANGDEAERLGNRFYDALTAIQKKHPETVSKIEGMGHLSAVHFHDIEQAAEFAKRLNEACIDASAQVYKKNCPPAVLFKPPVIASEKVLDYLAGQIEKAVQ